MTAATARSAPRTMSHIDIQLWAREQRRRWFVRNVAVPLQVLVRTMTHVAVRFLQPSETRAA
jgi:hypothetical protein